LLSAKIKINTMEPNSNPEFNKFFKRTTTKAFTEARATPVILVCIYNHNNTLITHDLLYNIFSQYGKVQKILIFEKVKVWKAFVEFSTLESAFDAKRNLNDFMIFSDGTRMNIYFSNLDTIKFQNNNSGGISYIPEEENNSPDLQNLQIPTTNYPKPNVQIPSTINDQNQMTNIFPPPNLRKNPSSNSPTTFDDKGDEIFKIINERQQDKNPPQNEEEEKHDTEDSESNSFNPSLLSVFQQKPSQPVIINHQSFAPKPKTTVNRPYEDADAVQRPIIVRHAGHKHTAPPGLAVYRDLGMNQGNFLPQQTEARRLIPSPGSFHQIGQVSPPKNVQSYRPTDFPPRIINPNPTFENRQPQQHFRANSSNYISYPNEGNPRIQPTNFSPSGPHGTDLGAPQIESGEGSPDNLGHQTLFDLIEQDIAAELNSKMKNLDINAGQGGYPENFPTGMQYGNNLYDNNDDKKSQILYVKGLDDRDISIQMIYNLFSNFGNVLKVIYIRSKAASLLEYENAEYATIAKDYLNNIVLMKKTPQNILF